MTGDNPLQPNMHSCDVLTIGVSPYPTRIQESGAGLDLVSLQQHHLDGLGVLRRDHRDSAILTLEVVKGMEAGHTLSI